MEANDPFIMHNQCHGMNADDMDAQGTTPKAAMLLTQFAWNIPVSAPGGLWHKIPPKRCQITIGI